MAPICSQGQLHRHMLPIHGADALIRRIARNSAYIGSLNHATRTPGAQATPTLTDCKHQPSCGFPAPHAALDSSPRDGCRNMTGRKQVSYTWALVLQRRSPHMGPGAPHMPGSKILKQPFPLPGALRRKTRPTLAIAWAQTPVSAPNGWPVGWLGAQRWLERALFCGANVLKVQLF